MELLPDKKLHIRKIETKRHDYWYLYGRMPRVSKKMGKVDMCNLNINVLRGMNWLASVKCAGVIAMSSCADNTGLQRQEQERPLGRTVREGSARGQPCEQDWEKYHR